MKKNVTLGIVGAGWAARKHLEVIRDAGWIKPAGITSRTKSKAQALADEFAIPFCADDLDSLVKHAKPDALMILVSADQIFKTAMAAMDYRFPLFIEKPAGLTPGETAGLCDIAGKNNIAVMVGFNRRFYSIFQKGLEIIKRSGGLLGVYVEGHERMWKVKQDPAVNEKILENWFFANSIHCVDLLRFFGGEANNVKNIVQSRIEKRGDQIGAVMELTAGGIGQYSAHWYSPGGWKVVLYGNGVTVEFKPLEKGVWIDKDFVSHEIEADTVDTRFKAGFYRQMEAFGTLVREGTKVWPAADLEDSLKTVLLAEKIYSR